ASPAFTSGRMPAKALRTSARSGRRDRYRPAASRMKSISSTSGRGSTGAVGTATSVVPTSVCPCHGMANSTRPSGVSGTSRALSAGGGGPRTGGGAGAGGAGGGEAAAPPGGGGRGGGGGGAGAPATPAAHPPARPPPARAPRPPLGPAFLVANDHAGHSRAGP